MPGRRLKDRPLAGLAAEHRAPHEGGAVHLLASLNAHDVGPLTIELTTPVPRQCPDGQPTTGPTATPPGARGKGVRHALAGTALTWAHDHGYQPASADFDFDTCACRQLRPRHATSRYSLIMPPT